MSNTADKCILCLTEMVKQEEDDYSQKELNTAFPDVDISDVKEPFQMCSKCRRQLDVFNQFKTFLKKSVYQRKKYIQTLDDSCEAQEQNFGELQVELSDSDVKVEEKVLPNTSDAQQCDTYIKQEIQTQQTSSSSIFNDSQIQTYKDEKTTDIICKSTNLRCEVCNKLFLCKSNLKNHMTVHKGSKKFECATCNKIFSHKATLRKHVTVHSDIKIRCIICSKIFSCPSKLKRHTSIHSDLRKFECSICNKKFKLYEYLTNHMATHSKKIECPICNKLFSRNTNFVAHMTIHTGMQNFECSFCHKKFAMKHHLLTHSVRHTGIKFECSICSKTYSTKFYLTKHMASHSS